MVFLGDIAFYMAVLVFSVGVFMVHHADHNNSGKTCNFLKKSGYLVILLSILGALCTGFYWLKYYGEGVFDSPSSNQVSMSTPINKNII